MANGVKLATAYIDITGDTSSVTQSVKDALDQSVKDAEPAGKKLGQKMSAGIEKGMDVFRDLGSKLSDDLSKGLDASKTGQQVGRDLQKAIEGADMGSVGKKLSTSIANATQGLATGQKIGQEIKTGADGALKDLGKGALDEFKQGARQWGQQVANEIRSGDIKGALNDVGNTAHNVTDIISNIGGTFGANLEGVRSAGTQIDTVLNKVGDAAAGIQTKVKTVADDFQRAFSGDVTSRAKGVAAVFRDLDPLTSKIGIQLGPAADSIEKFANTKDEIAGIAKSLGDVGVGLKDIPVLGPKAEAALAAVSVAAGPLAATAAMLMMIPGWANAAGNAVDQAQGKKPFNLKDWVHALAPGTNIEELILKQLGIKPGPPGGAPSGDLTPDWTNALPFPSVQSGLPGTTPNQEGLLPVTAMGKQQLNALFPGHTIGGFRQDQAYPNEHPAGKALDFMVSGVDEGSKYLSTALGLPGVQYVIFNNKMWYPDGRTEPYTGPSPHTDHLHIHFEPGQMPTKASGGALDGSGPVPIIAHGGEHVLTARDVIAAGGQDAVYAWRKALYYQGGGDIDDEESPWKPDWSKWAANEPQGNAAVRALPGMPGYFNPDVKLDTSMASSSGPPKPKQLSLWERFLRWEKGGEFEGGGDVGGTPDWLKEAADKAGMSPQDYLTAMAHLPPGGATPPGPAKDMQDNIWQQATGGTGQPGQFSPADIVELARTAGFLPSGAGSKAVAGTSFVAGILNIGNELVDTGIDVAAAAGKTAIQMAIAAASGAAQAGGSSGFSPGAGGAGGAIAAGGAVGQTLADWGIDLLANEAKRGVSYGFQVAAIGADSLIDQMFGMFGGPPRWLGYDYTQFLPSLNFGGLAVTTTEKAMQMAQAGIEQGIKQGQTPPQPGGPVAPQQMPGAQPVGPPVPKFGTPPPQLAPPAGVPGKQQMAPPPGGADIPPPPGAELPPVPGAPPQPTQGPAPAGAPPPGAPPPAPPPPPGPAPPSPPPEGINPLQLLFGFDEGGWWPPNTRGINTTGRPELVLSPQQLDTMKIGPMGNRYGGKGDTFHIYAMDADEVGREIDKRRRLAMMQYAGRP